MGINVDPEAFDAMPRSDHFSLTTRSSVPAPPRLGSELIYDNGYIPECSVGPDAPGDSLEVMVEDWHRQLSETIGVMLLLQISPLVYRGTKGAAGTKTAQARGTVYLQGDLIGCLRKAMGGQ